MNLSNIVGKFSLAVTAVTALLGYRFVIEQMMPQVGYLTVTDMIYILLLLISLACFIFQLLMTRLYMINSENMKNSTEEKRKKLEQKFVTLEKINSITFLITSLILTVATSLIVLI